MAAPEAELTMRALIVDGYNVLHSVRRYRTLLGSDIDAARGRLVDDLASFSRGSWRTTVVFDGVAGTPSSEPDEGVPGVRVLFGSADTEADTIVEALAREARDRGEEAVVVTRDASTGWAVLGGTVTRMSPAAFETALAEDERDRREGAPATPAAATVERRIDADTLSGLLRLRDGSD
ncbi:MAG TPA: NYN domain-containing protein [Coriobacteriia bacterium]